MSAFASLLDSRRALAPRIDAVAERRKAAAAFDAMPRPLKPPHRNPDVPSPSPAGSRALQRDLRLDIVPVLGRMWRS